MLLAALAAVLVENRIDFEYNSGNVEIIVTGSFHITRIRSDNHGIYIVGPNGYVEMNIPDIITHIRNVG